MTIRTSIRTGRTLWRVYRHRKAGHAVLVDPGAVTCRTCARNPTTGKGGHTRGGGVRDAR